MLEHLHFFLLTFAKLFYYSCNYGLIARSTRNSRIISSSKTRTRTKTEGDIGQGQGLEGRRHKLEVKDLNIGLRRSSRTRTFLENNNTDDCGCYKRL